MRYKQIDPELGPIARRIPYNRFMIACANIFLPLALTKAPPEISAGTVTLKGYKGLAFKTEVFEPAGHKGELPALIYAHGGAFSYKASPYHKRLACIYALRANCRVYFPDYHLAPRYPYPAAYEDILALYRYVMAEGCEKIGLAGDSAGGALAALVCGNYLREGLRPPCLQMLVYPLTDIDMTTDSMKRFADTPLWNAKNNRRMWRYYCGNPDDKTNRAASPMHVDLPKLIPDAYIETAELDCLHDEGVIYAQKLRTAGARVELNETRGTIHGYDCALNSRLAAESIKKRVLFLKRGFSRRLPC